MKTYHKIQTIFKRDPSNKNRTLLDGDWTLPEFEYLANNIWTFTEKVDGTNIRVMYAKQKITFGGKTDNAQIPAQLVERLNDLFLPKLDIFKDIFGTTDVCLYGEGYGAKIQKGGGNYKSTQDFVLFDILIDDWWLLRDNVEDIAENLSIDIVPIIGEGTLYDMIEQVKTGIKSTWGDFQAEGIVAKPKIEFKSRKGERLITKLKTRDYVVKN